MRYLIFFFLIIFIHLDLQGYSQQQIENFYLSNFNEQGTRDWEIRGKEAVVYGNHVDIDKMQGTYYSANDTVFIKSQKAKLDKENFNVFLREDVQIESQSGARLNTNSLNWIKKDNLITTSDWVKVEQNTTQITAEGMKADTQLKKVDFEENVEVNIPDKEGKNPMVITCDGPLEIEYNTGKAVFHNNVKFTSKDGEMFSDIATVFFDSKQKKIIKVIAQGNVKIIKEGNTTYAQKATYLGDEGRLILEGSPRIVYFPKEDETP